MSRGRRDALLTFAVYHPWLTLLLVLLVFGFFSQYLMHIQPSVSYQDLLGKDHPKLLDYEYIQREYTRDDNLLVLIEARDSDAFDHTTLQVMSDLTEKLWKTPYSIRVDSITNFQHSYAKGDELIVSDLYAVDESSEPRDPQTVRTIAVAEPLLINRATNHAGNVVAASVSFAFPNKDAGEKLEAYAYVVELTKALEQSHPELKSYVSGLVALDATVMDISQRETGLFLLLVAGVVIVLLALFMRAVMPVVVSIFVCVFSIVMALSLSGFMGWKLTPFTASVPLIILIIAVADCVHIVTTYLHELGHSPDKISALRQAVRNNMRPVAITSITTAIGFLTLNFSESDSIHALGNEVAFGVIAAFLFSITLLPAALRLLPQPNRKPAQIIRAQSGSVRMADFVVRYQMPILTIAAAVIVGLCLSIPRNEINDIIPHYFAESLPWRQANDFAEQEFGGAYTFSWSLEAAKTNGISEPEFLTKAERFVDWLRAKPEVVYVNSITDTFKRLNRNMHSDNGAYYKLPDEQPLAAQYLLLYEMSLPFGLDLNNQINLDKSSIRVQATFKTLSTSQILAMEREVGQWLAANLSDIKVTGSGVQLMFAHMLSQDVVSMVYGATLGLAVISLLLILAFRSFRTGLISLAPNLVPALLAFGVWGLTVGQIGMGLAMVSGMTIGIIVDDTVHFLYKYLLARRERQMSPREAVEYTYITVGPAIVFTTTVLITGFLLMTFLAEFRVNSDMAVMTSIVLAFALVFDLLVLPALLLILDRREESKSATTLPQEI
ncbi:MAG: MMPL family transporter [Chromatiales bacterium]|nr:MMPL family transporter [Chromatiales bacterium]